MTLSALARLWAETPPSPLHRLIEARRAQGLPVRDLVSPPAEATGLAFPSDLLREIVAEAAGHTRVLNYAPDPLGAREAREAIAKHGGGEPERLLLTPGTSLGYLYAFRALLERGQEILIPSPGYPLFEDIAAICGIGLRRYHLRGTGGEWRPDIDEIAFQCTAATRALVVISPHNPTGTVWSEGELEALRSLCEERGLALIFDGVFRAFTHPPGGEVPSPRGFPLSVTLDGFSKMFQMPGWKIGWMQIEGDRGRAEPLMRALAHLSDTFLPVGEIQQAMVPLVFQRASDFPAQTAETLHSRMTLLHDALSLRSALLEGGTYLCVPIGEDQSDDALAETLLREHGFVVHPGHYYDLPQHLVLTCLAPEQWLREGAKMLCGLL
jgi:hypothetical protein